MVISAIGGTAGVGKTALAVQWAHQAADRFPDGQLYVNLRGYDPDQPMPAADALAGFLRALGVGGQDIPPEEDERAARYRSLLAGRRVLIVLDNAGSVEQVRPLLPGSPACAVVVTSRDSLAGLVARDGATRLELDLLPPAEAVAPAARADRRAGSTMIPARPRRWLASAAGCRWHCGSPPSWPPPARMSRWPSWSASWPTSSSGWTCCEAGGDPRTAVRAVFSWSYRHLDADAARAFRLAGLHPGPDFEPTPPPRSPAPASRRPAGCWTC